MKIQTTLSFVFGCVLFSAGWAAGDQLPSSAVAMAKPDHPPVPINCPLPTFPSDLRKHSLVSEVEVAFVVDHTGTVTKLRVTDALVGRFNARGIIAHYVYNGNYALGRFIAVPVDGGKTSSPNPKHTLPEAPIVEVGSLIGAPPYIATSQSDFGEQARKTIATWKYSPAEKAGQPVDTPMRMVVMFWRDSTVSTAIVE